MKLVVQRVKSASVTVNNEIVGKISKGYLVLVGFGQDDTAEEADFLTNKLMKLRIFEDDDGRMNLSIKDIDGEILLVPQFTLYGDTAHHNRPSFSKAMKPDKAKDLFEYYCKNCSQHVHVETGIFGAFMDVSLINDGPVTILLEKEMDIE